MCIFCKKKSNHSIGREHIVPESLGNKSHVLPKGIVCDKCNNYFSRKVEKPLLETDFFTQTRFRNRIQSKKGRIPSLEPLLGPKNMLFGIQIEQDTPNLYPLDSNSLKQFLNFAKTNRTFSVRIPVALPPEKKLMSKLLAKMALEALTKRFMGHKGWENEIINKTELDLLRNYARYGKPNISWPFHERRIYTETKPWPELSGNIYEVLHEFDFLYTENLELYFVIAIFGIEYSINMAGPELEGYHTWLEENSHQSPLYINKNNHSNKMRKLHPNIF